MYSLGRVIGGILCQLGRAQVFSDYSTLGTAFRYAKQEHLKHFPVPQISIFDAEVDLKFAFAIDDKKPIMVSFDAEEKETLQKRLNEILIELIKDPVFAALFASVKNLEENWQKQIDIIIAKTTDEFLKFDDRETDVHVLVNAIVNYIKFSIEDILQHDVSALNTMKSLFIISDHASSPKEKTNELAKELQIRIREMILKILKMDALESGLSVLVTAQDLLEVPPQMVSSIKIKAGLTRKEWYAEEVHGEKVAKLVDK